MSIGAGMFGDEKPKSNEESNQLVLDMLFVLEMLSTRSVSTAIDSWTLPSWLKTLSIDAVTVAAAAAGSLALRRG